MSLELRLSDRARRDIQSITDYTVETWGIEQATRYIGGLADMFDTIVDNPGIGRPRKELAEGMRSLAYRSHLVFFRPEKDCIIISAVLHQSQDTEKHLGPPK